MTDSSEVQPIGKLKKYRKTIWTMKQTNMMPSRPATTFSARRRIQSTALPDGRIHAKPFPFTGTRRSSETGTGDPRGGANPVGAANRCCGPRHAMVT